MPSRYRKEIEEILEQTSNVVAQQTTSPSSRHRGVKSNWVSRAFQFGFSRWITSPGKLMMVSIGLLLSAWLLGAFAPPVAGPVALAGAVLFIASYALFFIRPVTPRVERRWRGRPIGYDHRSWKDLLQRWFKP